MSGVPVFRQISPWVALPEYIYSANDPKITDEPGVWRSLPEDEAREAVVAAARNWNALPWNDDRRIEASRLFMDALDRLDALTKGDA